MTRLYHKSKDLSDVTLVYADKIIWLDFRDVTLVSDDNTLGPKYYHATYSENHRKSHNLSWKL